MKTLTKKEIIAMLSNIVNESIDRYTLAKWAGKFAKDITEGRVVYEIINHNKEILDYLNILSVSHFRESEVDPSHTGEDVWSYSIDYYKQVLSIVTKLK